MQTFAPRWLPFLAIFATYHRGNFRKDLNAGLTTAFVLIPQSMAYAMLAGLPPYVGLYAAAIPLLAYAFLGTSPVLAVGPVAMDSLLTATAVGALASTGTDEYLELAIVLALLVGLIQLLLGILRAGFVVNALSQPVIAGFTAAAALIIGFNQLKLLLGIALVRTTEIYKILLDALAQWRTIHLPTVTIGLSAIAALLLLKKFKPNWPKALMVLIAGSLAVVAFQLGDQGVAIIGEVPAGLPSLHWPHFQWQQVIALLPAAFIIAMVGFIEAFSVAKSLNLPQHPDLRANQELIALGSANLAAGLFRGFPVTGGFSRSAVNASAGATTQIAAIITAATVLLTISFFTPLMAAIPTAVLGAIIVTAVLGLIDIAHVHHFWQVRKSDFWLYCLTFAATLAFGIQQGIFAGVIFSLFWFIAATSKPHIAVLGRLPNTQIYRNIHRFPQAIQRPGELILRFDAPLFFANTNYLKNQLKALESDMNTPLTTVLLDASGIGRVDTTGADMLIQLAKELQTRQIDLHLACLRGPVHDVLLNAGLFEVVPQQNLILELHLWPSNTQTLPKD